MIRSLSFLLCAASLVPAATVQYSSQVTFNAALGGAVTTIDFASIGGGGSDVAMNNYNESGATFTGAGGYLYGRDYSGGFIYGPFNNNIHVALPTGTIGVGLNLSRFYDTTHGYEVQLSNGDVFSLGGVNQFAGFISSTPLTSLDVKILSGSGQGIYNLTSDYVLLFDVSFSQVPEPSTGAIVFSALTAGAWVRWRRRQS